MFSNILIPIDDSEPAKRAAKYGLEFAATYEADIDLLHVDGGKAASEHAPTALDDVLALDIAGEPAVNTHRTDGSISDAVVSHVDEADSDLVVMGRHGRAGISQHLLGSVTERVLRRVPVPVLTVTGNGVDADTGWNDGDILLTTDGSDVAETAAPYAADVADRTGATLHLLTVVDVLAEAGIFDAGGVSEEFVDRLHDDAEGALDGLRGAIDDSELDVRTAVVEDRIIDGIEQYTAEQEIDLLVVASEGQTDLVGQRVGSTTSRILNSIDRPVLVIPVLD